MYEPTTCTVNSIRKRASSNRRKSMKANLRMSNMSKIGTKVLWQRCVQHSKVLQLFNIYSVCCFCTWGIIQVHACSVQKKSSCHKKCKEHLHEHTCVKIEHDYKCVLLGILFRCIWCVTVFCLQFFFFANKQNSSTHFNDIKA